jgi:dipeptidyl aminopeptidase/acylaminoacyl peptidase
MSGNKFDMLERFEPLFDTPEPSFERFRRRRERKRRNQRITAGVVGIAVFVAAVLAVTTIGPFDRTPTPAAPGTDTGPTVTGPSETGPAEAVGPVPATDYSIDLDTGVMTPLPVSIVGAGEVHAGEYTASPDGSRLAYVAPGDTGSGQIFVANLDGTGVEQVTHDLNAAESPSWSPDGSMLAYIGYHDTLHKADDLRDVFVLDLATGASTQLTFATWDPDPSMPGWSPWKTSSPSFTPDGSSIVFNAFRDDAEAIDEQFETRLVPVAGGESVTLTWNGYKPVYSRDGSQLSYYCGDVYLTLCVASADGTDERVLVPGGGDAINGNAWSPDGTRIAYFTFHAQDVLIVDVATGQTTHVAEGGSPAWLNDHTLIVHLARCFDPATSTWNPALGCGG